MERYICIHGHFYQPPRENAWLEGIELQDSAYPFHDWNERITDECYAANGASRVLDGSGRILWICNNYSRISFNFGPTLLSWMEEKSPTTYQAILDADQESMKHFAGHGSALAQAYNHMILPLANRRDKETQIWWGIRDFEYRFGRRPEGMWLAETAVDLETLDIMADYGIRFTVLAPNQAARMRPLNDNQSAPAPAPADPANEQDESDGWVDVSGGRVDPTTPYLQRLPSGRTIVLFFYDGPISQGVAFEGLLIRGENLANRLLGAFTDDGRAWPQLVHIATDGETYGHHHRHGEMALTYALSYIESNNLAHITIYGEYLEKHPPTYEVDIFENSSWSCVHGVERWRSNCGCNSGMHDGWHQEWRAPLRDALDWLRDAVTPLYEQAAGALLSDPWAARDAYIEVILDRSVEHVQHFLKCHALRQLTDDEQSTVLKLLELQRHAMLMYTSCGWFFDELSGIETVQIMQYAGRVLQLAADTPLSQQASDGTLEAGFLEKLALASSNLAEHRDGADIFETFVKPARLDLQSVLAHYAISYLFESYGSETRIYCYIVECQDCHVLEYGKVRLNVGRAIVKSTITWKAQDLCFGVLHFGDHNLTGGLCLYNSDTYDALVHDVTEPFRRADLPETIRVMDKHFQGLTYSLRTLFRDEQRKILKHILESSLDRAEAAYRQVYDDNAPLMRFLSDLAIPLPTGFHTAAEFVLNVDLRRAFEDEEVDINRIQSVLEEVQHSNIALHATELNYALKGTLEWMEERMYTNPTNLSLLQKTETLVGLARTLPFEVDFWKIQNVYHDMQQGVYPVFLSRSTQASTTAEAWINHFIALGEQVGFSVDGMRADLARISESRRLAEEQARAQAAAERAAAEQALAERRAAATRRVSRNRCKHYWHRLARRLPGYQDLGPRPWRWLCRGNRYQRHLSKKWYWKRLSRRMGRSSMAT
jgi:alpha-amylase/alpha-mannosidase (GH57 family)